MIVAVQEATANLTGTVQQKQPIGVLIFDRHAEQLPVLRKDLVGIGEVGYAAPNSDGFVEWVGDVAIFVLLVLFGCFDFQKVPIE